MRLISLLAVVVAVASATGPVLADETPAASPLFASDTILDVKITAPLAQLSRERSVDEYLPGTFQFKNDDGEYTTFDVGIRARGHFRAKPSVCAMPPLRLNFKKSQLKDSLFAGQDKLKLVTHCQPNSFYYEQAMLSEYLSYRILNILSDNSFRVRLIRVSYVDADGGDGDENYAFLVEHKDQLGARIGLPPLDIESTTIDRLDPAYLNLTSVFQYLIGNADFSPIAGSPGDQCCHNYTLFGRDDAPFISVPYDFDMTGMVAPPHAQPNPKLRLDSIKERIYRGRCINNEILDSTLQLFLEKRAAIEALVNDQPELGSSTRGDMLKYIRSFYRTISAERAVKRNMLSKCE